MRCFQFCGLNAAIFGFLAENELVEQRYRKGVFPVAVFVDDAAFDHFVQHLTYMATAK
jgi:hypothetical protein